jgi:hypothetical protein
VTEGEETSNSYGWRGCELNSVPERRIVSRPKSSPAVHVLTNKTTKDRTMMQRSSIFINVPYLLLFASLSSSLFTHSFPLVSSRPRNAGTRSTRTVVVDHRLRSTTTTKNNDVITVAIENDNPTLRPNDANSNNVPPPLLTYESISNLRYRELIRHLQVRGVHDVTGRTTSELRRQLSETVFPDYVCIVDNAGEEVCGPEQDMNVRCII